MRQAGGRRCGVMIVVQSLSGRQKSQPLQVASSVRVWPTAEVVTHTVDRRRRRQIQIGVDERRQQSGPRAENCNQDGDSYSQTDEGSIEEPPVPSIRRQVAGVSRDEFWLTNGSPVQSNVRQLHPPPSEEDGGVRISLHVGVRMMLPMDGDPLSRSDSGGDPDENSTDRTHWCGQRQSTVRKSTVQIHGCDQIRQHRGGESSDDGCQNDHHARNLASEPKDSVMKECVMDTPAETARSRLHPPVDTSVRERWMKFGKWDRVYFPQLVGIEVVDVRQDYCRMSMPFRSELEQPMGIVHGGAIATLLDVVVVPAIGTGLEPDVGYSTVDMHVQYLNALIGETAVAEGWVVKRGRSLVFCDAEIVGETSGKTIARASLTYFLVPSRPYSL